MHEQLAAHHATHAHATKRHATTATRTLVRRLRRRTTNDKAMSAKAAVIYARTASRATVDSAALDQQIAVCELGAAEIGAEVVGIFAEGGVSGNTADRPVLNALLARLAEQDVDLLICLDPTRIARSFEVYRAITEYADMLGVRVVFVNDLSRRERANGSAQ